MYNLPSYSVMSDKATLQITAMTKSDLVPHIVSFFLHILFIYILYYYIYYIYHNIMIIINSKFIYICI